MLKAKGNKELELPMGEFIKFNEPILYDANIPPDEYTPLSHAPHHNITPEELTNILSHHFKADKSSGMSKMPL